MLRKSRRTYTYLYGFGARVQDITPSGQNVSNNPYLRGCGGKLVHTEQDLEVSESKPWNQIFPSQLVFACTGHNYSQTF